VSIKGGSPTSIGRVQGVPQCASWNSHNTIVFATTDHSTGLLTVSADGGEPTVLTEPNPADGEVDHLFPSFLPSGDAVLFTVTTKRGIDFSEVTTCECCHESVEVAKHGTGLMKFVALELLLIQRLSRRSESAEASLDPHAHR
jgi:hypothetical protein